MCKAHVATKLTTINEGNWLGYKRKLKSKEIQSKYEQISEVMLFLLDNVCIIINKS